MELAGRGLRNRVAITVLMQFFQQWTGINVILYYQSRLLLGMGLDPQQASISFTIANNVVNSLATFPGMYLIERVGRRPLLLYGGFIMGAAHYLVCLFIKLGDAAIANNPGSTSSGFYWAAICSV